MGCILPGVLHYFIILYIVSCENFDIDEFFVIHGKNQDLFFCTRQINGLFRDTFMVLVRALVLVQVSLGQFHGVTSKRI